MKTINFKQFELYADIAKERTIKADVARNIADLIYKSATGIMAHDLAIRIYESTGPIEVNDEEVQFLSNFFKAMTTPAFQDSFTESLKDNGDIQ